MTDNIQTAIDSLVQATRLDASNEDRLLAARIKHAMPAALREVQVRREQAAQEGRTISPDNFLDAKLAELLEQADE